VLTTQTPLPQYLVCDQLAVLALGLTGLKMGPKESNSSRRIFRMPAKKKPAKKAAKKKSKK
jgi:hypothetical protein